MTAYKAYTFQGRLKSNFIKLKHDFVFCGELICLLNPKLAMCQIITKAFLNMLTLTNNQFKKKYKYLGTQDYI